MRCYLVGALKEINDFPAYAMLSGWSTKGKFACPYCHRHTDYLWLKFGSKHCYMGHHRFLPLKHKWRRNKVSFNNKAETREGPVPLSGEQVKQDYESFEQVIFGKDSKKRSNVMKTIGGTIGGKRVYSLSSLIGNHCWYDII